MNLVLSLTILAINTISPILNLKLERSIIEPPRNELYSRFNLSIQIQQVLLPLLALKVKDTTCLLSTTIRGLLQSILSARRISSLVLYKGTITRSILNLTLRLLEFILTMEQSSIVRKQPPRQIIQVQNSNLPPYTLRKRIEQQNARSKPLLKLPA